jgi:hypothetical protein
MIWNISPFEVITTAKLMKIAHRLTSSIRMRPNGTYYIAVPKADMRAFIRKLPPEAHSVDPNKKHSYVILDVLMTWEGLVND